MEDIDKLLDAIIKAQSGMDERTFWPCHPAQAEAYFSDLIADALLEKFIWDNREFGRAIDKVPPDFIRFHLLDAGLIGLKVLKKYGPTKVSDDLLFDFISALVGSIQRRVGSDPFCSDGKNLLVDASILKELDFLEVKNLSEKQAISSLNITAESLSWAIYFDLYRDLGMIIHGPYAFDSGRVIVRDFSLNDIRLSTYVLYDKGFSLEIDFANHIIYHQPHMDFMKAAGVIYNGNPVGLDNLEKMEEQFSKLRHKLVEKVEKMRPKEIIWECALKYWQLFEKFFDYYGESCLPPIEIKNRIKESSLKYWTQYQPTSQKHDLNYFRRLYNPRNDFLG